MNKTLPIEVVNSVKGIELLKLIYPEWFPEGHADNSFTVKYCYPTPAEEEGTTFCEQEIIWTDDSGLFYPFYSVLQEILLKNPELPARTRVLQFCDEGDLYMFAPLRELVEQGFQLPDGVENIDLDTNFAVSVMSADA